MNIETDYKIAVTGTTDKIPTKTQLKGQNNLPNNFPNSPNNISDTPNTPDTMFYHGNKFPIGSIVYFIDRCKISPFKKYVNYGIVRENRCFEIYVEKLTFNYANPTIDGIPVKDIFFPTKWKKLPKNWSWDTKLFDYNAGTIPFYEKYYKMPITSPEIILEMLNVGTLIPVSQADSSKYEAFIDRQNGWRIERKHSDHLPYPYIRLPHNKLFTEHSEAYNVILEEENELKRISCLTDEEWAIEEIDRTLNKMWHKTESEVAAMREYLLSLPKIEEIEVRICGMELQWKREHQKKWSEIII